MAHTCGYVHLKTQLGWSPGQGEESSPALQRPPPPCRDATLTLPAASGDMGRSLGSSLLSHSGQEIFAWKEMTAKAKIAALGSPFASARTARGHPLAGWRGWAAGLLQKLRAFSQGPPKSHFKRNHLVFFFPRHPRHKVKTRVKAGLLNLKKLLLF